MFKIIENIVKSKNLSGEAFFITETSVGIKTYTVLLESPTEKELTSNFAKKLEDTVVKPNSGKSQIPLVSNLLERDRQVFEYDHASIGHLPIEFIELSKVLNYGINGSPTNFDFNTQKLHEIKALMYHLSDGAGNSVVLYQHKYPISLHKKSKRSFFSTNGRTLKKVSYDSIDINDTIDFFYFNNKYYSLNISLLERFYGLEKVIDNLAASATPMILALSILDTSGISTPNDIFKDMHKDRSFMRRLAMVSKGDIVKTGISISQIQQVAAQFPILGRNIQIQNNLVRLKNKDHKRYFIRLLNNEASFAALNNLPFLAVEKDPAN